MRLAYLVNEYPKISHTFIRREIHSLEARGVDVQRYSIRGWNSVLVDAADEKERQRTRYILKDGVVPLLFIGLLVLLTSPRAFARAASSAWRMGRGLSRKAKSFAYLLEACQVLSWAQRAGIEHVHAHFGNNSAAVAMLVKRLGGPDYSFTIHGQEEVYSGSIADKVRYAKFVVAISSFGRSQLYLNLPVDLWSRVEVIRCGLEETFFEYPDSVVPSRSPFLLFCLGRLCREKGQHLLLEAVAKLVRSGRTLDLVFGGDGEMRAELEKSTGHLGLRHRVRFLGNLSAAEVREAIHSSDCVVLPSLSEGLPVALMEAMAMRRPVISTYVGGIPELVEHGRSGWLVPAGSVMALADAIGDAMDKGAAARDDMGRAARERVWGLHRASLAAGRLLELFAARSILQARPENG